MSSAEQPTPARGPSRRHRRNKGPSPTPGGARGRSSSRGGRGGSDRPPCDGPGLSPRGPGRPRKQGARGEPDRGGRPRPRPHRGGGPGWKPPGFQRWQGGWCGAFLPHFGAVQANMDFTSDAMWPAPGPSFEFAGPERWQQELAPVPPFYRREQKAPTPSKTKLPKAARRLVQQAANDGGMKTRNRAQRRASLVAVRTPATPKTAAGKSPKKATTLKTTKKIRVPVKSAEQLAEETRLSAMKDKANKIKTLLKKPKLATTKAPPSDWVAAPERETAAAASGPRYSRNLLGELEFSSKDWQAIGSGGLGSTDTTDLVPEGDSEDDDTVEIIERAVEEPEVISIAGGDDSDEEEDEEEGEDVEDPPEDAQDPLMEIDSLELLDSPAVDPLDVDAADTMNAVDSMGAVDAVDAVDAVVTVNTVNTEDKVDAANAADARAVLDEFDAADITLSGTVGGWRAADTVGTSASAEAAEALTLYEAGPAAAAAATPRERPPLAKQCPRSGELPPSGPAPGGTEVSSSPPLPARGSPQPEARSSPRLRARSHRSEARSQFQSELEPQLQSQFESQPQSESRPRFEPRSQRQLLLDFCPQSELRARSQPQPDFRPQFQSRCQPLSDFRPQSESHSQPQSESHSQPQTQSQSESRPQSESGSHPQPRPNFRPQLSSRSQSQPDSEPQSQPDLQPVVRMVRIKMEPPPDDDVIAVPRSPPVHAADPSPVPDDDSVVFLSPDADSHPLPRSSVTRGRKRRVSDTLTPPEGARQPPTALKRVRSSSECSVLAEPAARPPLPLPAPARPLVRRLMRMDKESLRTLVDDPKSTRSRHLVTELMRAHRSQLARRMEQARFATVGGSAGSGGGGSPVRRESEEELPPEVLTDLRRILETEEGGGQEFPSAPLPAGLLSAARIGGTGHVDQMVREAPPGSAAGLSAASVSAQGSTRPRIAHPTGASYLRATLPVRVSPSSPRRGDSSARVSAPTRAPAPAAAGSTPVCSAAAAAAHSSSVATPPDNSRRMSSTVDEVEIVETSAVTRTVTSSSGGCGVSVQEERGRFASLSGSSRFAALDGSAARPGSAVSSTQGRARSPPPVVVSASASGAQRGKAPLTAGEIFTGAGPPQERSFRPNVGAHRGSGGGAGGRKHWECRSCFAQSWTNTCRIFRRHVTVIEKDVDRMTSELSSREPAWNNLLQLSMVEDQIIGQVEEMEEQVSVLQGEMRRLRQISRHLRDVRIKCMSYGSDVQSDNWRLPPEVQQLLRRLAEHAPAAAHPETAAEHGIGDGVGGTEGEGRLQREGRAEEGGGTDGEAGGCGEEDGAGPRQVSSHPAEDQCGSASLQSSAKTNRPSPAAASQTPDPRLPDETNWSADSQPPAVRQIKQEATDVTSTPRLPAASPNSPPTPTSPTTPQTPTLTTSPAAAEVKREPECSGRGDGGHEDEVSLARAMVRVRNESELNEMAAALRPEPEKEGAPGPGGDATLESEQEQESGQEKETSAAESGQEQGQGPAMAYLGHIDSSSDIYRSLLALTQQRGNQVLLQMAPEGEEAGSGQAQGEGEEPRMSVAEMAAVKMEEGDDGEGAEERERGVAGEGGKEVREEGKGAEEEGEKEGMKNGAEGEKMEEGDKKEEDEEKEEADKMEECAKVEEGENVEERDMEEGENVEERDMEEGEKTGEEEKTEEEEQVKERGRTEERGGTEEEEKVEDRLEEREKLKEVKETEEEGKIEEARRKEGVIESEKSGNGTVEGWKEKRVKGNGNKKGKNANCRHDETNRGKRKTDNQIKRNGGGKKRGESSEESLSRTFSEYKKREYTRRRTISEKVEDIRRGVAAENRDLRRRTVSEKVQDTNGRTASETEHDAHWETIPDDHLWTMPEEDCGERPVSGEDLSQRTVSGSSELADDDVVASRTQLDDLGVPIVCVQLHGPCIFVLTAEMVLHRYTVPPSFVHSLSTLQVVCDSTPLWSATAPLPRPRPTCMVVKQVGQRVNVLIGDDTGCLTILQEIKGRPAFSIAAAESRADEIRSVQVGGAISSLAHKGSRLYIGGDSFFAIVNVERLLSLKEFPESDGRPQPVRYWPRGEVLLHWCATEGDVACVRPFHRSGSEQVALCLQGRPLELRDGIDGELLSTVGLRAAHQSCHLVTRWGHALYTVPATSPPAARGAACSLSAVDLESSSFPGGCWRLLQPITALDADGDYLYVGQQDGSLRLMRCVAKASSSSSGVSLRSVQQLRSVGSAPLQAVAARSSKVVTGSSSGLVELFVVPEA